MADHRPTGPAAARGLEQDDHRTPRWVRAFMVVGLVLVVVFIGLKLAGGDHGPGRHSPGGDTPPSVTKDGGHRPPFPHRP